MKTLHVISHTHWDREWYLTFQQFRLKLVYLVDKLLEILESDPEYGHFLLDGQTIVLDDYLYMRPEKASLLRKYIEEGRIMIGPWHILPDMFLVSPEGHIRNLLQGDRTAGQFGPKMQVGYIPDSFGHPGQIPQILKGFGIESASLWRGLSGQPPELRWESPDGSSVFLAYLRDSYSNGANLPVHDLAAFTRQIALAADSLAAHAAIDDVLIMLGTDHMVPSSQTSTAIAFADSNLPNMQVIHSTLPAYIKAVMGKLKDNETLPVVRGELRACDRSPLLPGVLSTRMWIKQRNHYSQNLLEKWVEPFSVFYDGWTSGAEDDVYDEPAPSSQRIRNLAPIIQQTWRLLMENHPHDSICGCSIDQVHREMGVRFDQVDQIAEQLTLQSLQALAGAVATKRDDSFSALVIFNPLDSTRCDVIETALNIPEGVDSFELVDSQGKLIPYETLGSNHDEIANLLLKKQHLRDTIGAINEGWVAGMAIIRVNVYSEGATATIDAILDEQGQPNREAWISAEEKIAQFETDPTITHFHVLARTPQSSRIRFVSPRVSAFGWTTVWVRAVRKSESESIGEINLFLKPFLPMLMRLAETDFGSKLMAKLAKRKVEKPPYVIENEYYQVEVNRVDGTLTILDKITGQVYSGLNWFVDGGDRGDEYNYCPPLTDLLIEPDLFGIKVFSEKACPALIIKALIRVPEELAGDRKRRSKERVRIPITSRVMLMPGVRRIDVRTEIENRAKDHRLRVHFNAPFLVNEAHFDSHFEVVQRPIRLPEKGEDWVEDPRPEAPQRAFTDITNGQIGLMIANRGLPEVEVISAHDHTEIALTLLRCVGWLSRDDLPVREGYAGSNLETPDAQLIGKWVYDYAIIPHQDDWRLAYQQAFHFETPMRAVETGLHHGTLPLQGSFIETTPDAFVISAIKATENGTGWIVRGYNITGEDIQVGIKPKRGFSAVYRVNLAEEQQQPLSVDDDGWIRLSVHGHQVVSVMFLDR